MLRERPDDHGRRRRRRLRHRRRPALPRRRLLRPRSTSSPYQFTLPPARSRSDAQAQGGRHRRGRQPHLVGDRHVHVKDGLPDDRRSRVTARPARRTSSRARSRSTLSATDGGGGARRDPLHARRLRPDAQLAPVQRPVHAHGHDHGQVPHLGPSGNAEPVQRPDAQDRRDRARPRRSPRPRTARACSRATSPSRSTRPTPARASPTSSSSSTATTSDSSRSSSSPYEFTLPAGTLPLGTHRLKALVTDALGNRDLDRSVTITVKDGLPDHHDRL